MAKLTKNESAYMAYASDVNLAMHFGISRATVWRWASERNFPAPVKLSPQITRWRWAEVKAWELLQTKAA